MPIGFRGKRPSGYEEEDFEEEPEESGFVETLPDEEDSGLSGLAKMLILLAMGWGVAVGILVETLVSALEGLLP